MPSNGTFDFRQVWDRHKPELLKLRREDRTEYIRSLYCAASNHGDDDNLSTYLMIQLDLLETCQTSVSLTMNDNRVQIANSHIDRSAVGAAASFAARDINQYDIDVDNSVGLKGGDLKALLKSVRQGLEQVADSPLKVAVIDDYAKLTEELSKEKPDPGMLSHLWRGVERIGAALPTVVELGKLLTTVYGMPS